MIENSTLLIILSSDDYSWLPAFFIGLGFVGILMFFLHLRDKKYDKIAKDNKRNYEQHEEDKKKKCNWEYGEIPIINKNTGGVNLCSSFPNYKNWQSIPSGLNKYLIEHPLKTIEQYKITEKRLEAIPEYCYLRDNGSKFSYKSIFYYLNDNYDYKNYDVIIRNKYENINSFSNLLSNKQEIPNLDYINFRLLNNEIKIIEYLSLNEIKNAVREIKQKIQEEKDRIKEIETEKRKKQLIIDRWNEIESSFKFEIIENPQKSYLSGIYLIRCIPTNHIYIGSSKNMALRKSEHLQQLKSKSPHHSYRLQEAFDKYGEEDFKFYALETIDLNSDVVNNSSILKQIEQYYINKYNPEFNIEKDAFGKKHY